MAGLFDYEFQLEKINQHKPPLQKLDVGEKFSLFQWHEMEFSRDKEHY